MTAETDRRGAMPSRFRRQFFAAPRDVPEFDTWPHLTLGRLHVYAHPDLGLVNAKGAEGAAEVVLLGFALDPDAPELDNRAIAHRIAASRTRDELIAACVGLAGRWALLAEAEGETFALHDPCGLRMVHYILAEDGPYLASNPALLGKVTPLRAAPFAQEYLDSRHRRTHPEHWLPSGLTLLADVGHLVPNHWLRVETGEQTRYWPTAPLARRALEDAVPRAGALLRRLVDAGAARFSLSLPITAGWDSRILLAAARAHAPDLFAYTLVSPGMTADSPDVRIPAAMLPAVGLRHHRIECTEAPSEAFAAAYRAHVDLAHESWERTAWGLHRGYPDDRVCLKGNGAEIARNSWLSYLPPHPTVRDVAEPEFEGFPPAVEALERWMAHARPLCAATGMDVVDLLYWEHVMGSWQARSQQEWDVAQEAFTPYNHRPLLETLLSVPVRERKPPRARLSHALLTELWPELTRWPVNPKPAGRRLRTAALELAERLGVLHPARRAWRRLRTRLGRATPSEWSRAGFTLVEVMVALVVMGVVIAGARAMLGQLADGADRITLAAVEADRDANAEALLRTIAGRLEISPRADEEIRFEGEPRGARFHSWCEVPDGWLERCEAFLGFIQPDGEPVLALRLSTGELVPLRRGFTSGELVYLRDAGNGGAWVQSWGASITAPLALGIVIDGDTTFVRVGERG